MGIGVKVVVFAVKNNLEKCSARHQVWWCCLHYHLNFHLWIDNHQLIDRRIGSVLHQDEGGIGKSIPDAQEISGDPKD